MSIQNDLFGNEVETDKDLFDSFGVPPFSILDTRTEYWQNKKRDWKKIGILSEIGRDENLIKRNLKLSEQKKIYSNGTSIFDPFLTELMYNWFCKKNGKIIDPFAGGSVRGIVANKLGYNYTGIDLRKEQIDSNKEQGETICGDNCPIWYYGDSERVLDGIKNNYFDFAFTCPPYGKLEKYSDLEEDLSNMDYYDFILKYSKILEKTVNKLKDDTFFVIVVGEFRDKNGNYVGFIKDTINILSNINDVNFYNEMILLNPVASVAYTVRGMFEASRKCGKCHQNVLVFVKGDPKKATERLQSL